MLQVCQESVKVSNKINPNKSYSVRWSYNKKTKHPYRTTYRKSDLIETTYFNPTSNSKIIYMLQVDLDYDRVTNKCFLQDENIYFISNAT